MKMPQSSFRDFYSFERPYTNEDCQKRTLWKAEDNVLFNSLSYPATILVRSLTIC